MTGNRWTVLALLGTAFFMTVLDGTSLLTALPTIERQLRLGSTATQWTVTVYALAFSGPLLLCGRAADLLGRRRMFLTGMALRVPASLLCGFAPSGVVLVAARALQGASAAIIAPAALSMVMHAFPSGATRNRALGVWGALGGVGATTGLLLGGALTDTLGWPWVFWINVPVGILVLTLAPAVLRDSGAPARPGSFDLTGATAATAALVLLVYAITRVPVAGWTDTGTAGAASAALVLAALFVLAETRSAAPLLPVRLLRSRMLIGGNLLILIAGMAVDGMLITLTSYTQEVLGWSAARFGLVAAVMTVTSVAGALAGQRAATRLGVRRTATSGAALLAAACLLLTRVPTAGSPALLPVALLVFGTGMGVAAVCSQIAALAAVAEKVSGLAAGLADTSFAVGTALGVAVCSSVARGFEPDELISGLRAAFGTAGMFAIAGSVVALALFTIPSARKSAGIVSVADGRLE